MTHHYVIVAAVSPEKQLQGGQQEHVHGHTGSGSKGCQGPHDVLRNDNVDPAPATATMNWLPNEVRRQLQTANAGELTLPVLDLHTH